MMNQRERDALDAHITGHYGEDQFPDETDEPHEHAWQPGPVIWSQSEVNDYGQTSQDARLIVLVCACGALLRRAVPQVSDVVMP